MGILGLAQGFVALAVSFLPAEPNASLAWWLFVGAVVCVVAGVLLFAWPRNTEEPTATATQSGTGNVQIQGQTVNFQGTISTGEEEIPSARLSDGRILVDVTPEYLTGLFRGHTTIQAERLFDAFVGKWMRVSGRVLDVTSEHGGSAARAHLVYAEEPDSLSVFLSFNDMSIIDDQVRVLKKGDWVTGIGQINSANPSYLSLENCELETP